MRLHVALLVCLASALGLGLVAAAEPAAAAAVDITVDVGTTYDSAANIEDFMGIQGSPDAPDYDWHNPDPWVVAAWTALGLDSSENCLFDDGGDYGVLVTHNATGGLDLDFTGLDARVDYLMNTLGAEVDFDAVWMPKELSYFPRGLYYWTMAAADYAEWYEAVYRTVLHIKNDLGLEGANYQVWNEPHYDLWRGKKRRPGDPLLYNDFMEMYFETWHAIKDADPNAQVGTPMTPTCSEIYDEPWGGNAFGIEDVISGIAEYNQQHPSDPVTLDYVIWQDYNWVAYPDPNYNEDGTFTDCVAHVQDVLEQNGLPADTPQVLIGWNGQNDHPNAATGAAHLVANVIEQTAPDGQRGIARAYYWPWFYTYEEYPESLVTHGAAGYSKRQGYAAMQALHDMRNGLYVQTTQSGGSPLRAMGTREGTTRFVAIVSNNHTGSAHTAAVTFNNLPAGWTTATCTVKRIDETNSADGQGLEAGVTEQVPVSNGSTTVNLELPDYSVRQVILEP